MKHTTANPDRRQKDKPPLSSRTTKVPIGSEMNPYTDQVYGKNLQSIEGDFLLMQQVLGNRAVSGMMRIQQSGSHSMLSLQSQATNEEQSLDAELDVILARIPSPPKVPAFEAITSTTEAEYSKTEWENAMQNAWKRERLSFTQTARRVAGTQSPNRPMSTEGPQQAPAVPYARRWTLNLIATHYKKSTLSHIANFLEKGSPFEKAQSAESDKVINSQDPTGAKIKSDIRDAILGMFEVLPANQIGELVVYFSGHGSGGHMVGVDKEHVTPEDMQSLANFARDWNVHIVFILDTCRAGALVNVSQHAALAQISEEGQKLQNVPGEQRQRLSRLYTTARGLYFLAKELDDETYNASEVLRLKKKNTDANRLAWIRAFNAVSMKAKALDVFLDTSKVTPEQVNNLPQLKKAIQDFNSAILNTYIGGRREYTRSLRSTAILLDTLNTSINTLIEQINRQMNTAQSEAS